MGDRFPGGVISKTPPSVSGPGPGTGGAASGVWTLGEVLGYVEAGVWPGEPLPAFELYTWGYGGFGRLGHNSTASLSSPTQVGALSHWAQAAGGGPHSACVTLEGTLFTWGYNQNKGTLGLNDLINRSSPVQVGALTNWAQVAAGSTHTACVKTDGTLWTWGYNSNGQLGHNDVIDKSSPVQVGALTDWAQVSTLAHTLCVKTDGTLWAWGIAASGQLGLNDTAKRSSPVQVGALTNWSQASSASGISACVKTDGTLFTWGYRSGGRLGQNDYISKSSPVQVGALTNWAQVAASSSHTACVKTDGTLFTWGTNNTGHLGHNNTIALSSPVQVGALTNWAQVAVGDKVTACATTAGTLFTWGDNSALFVNLGHNDTILRSSPVQVGALTSWSQVAAGNSHILAITST